MVTPNPRRFRIAESLGKVNEHMSIFQITVKGRDSSNNEFRNVHHYEFPFYVPDSTALQEAVDAIDAAYKSNLQSQFSSNITFYAYDVRRVDIGDQPTIELTATGGAWAGTAADNKLPNQVSALCTFKSLTAYPRTTRTYHFPMTEGTNSASGALAATTQGLIEDWAADMLSLDITGQLDADKCAVKYGGDPRVVIDNNDVQVIKVGLIWATQRRRRSGVGI